MNRPLRLLAVAGFTGVALVAVSPSPAVAQVGGRFHYDHAQVVATRDALQKAALACTLAVLPVKGTLMQVVTIFACSGGMKEAHTALEQADNRGCGLDVDWVDRGPMSYDTDYTFTVCP